MRVIGLVAIGSVIAAFVTGVILYWGYVVLPISNTARGTPDFVALSGSLQQNLSGVNMIQAVYSYNSHEFREGGACYNCTFTYTKYYGNVSTEYTEPGEPRGIYQIFLNWSAGRGYSSVYRCGPGAYYPGLINYTSSIIACYRLNSSDYGNYAYPSYNLTKELLSVDSNLHVESVSQQDYMGMPCTLIRGRGSGNMSFMACISPVYGIPLNLNWTVTTQYDKVVYNETVFSIRESTTIGEVAAPLASSVPSLVNVSAYGG